MSTFRSSIILPVIAAAIALCAVDASDASAQSDEEEVHAVQRMRVVPSLQPGQVVLSGRLQRSDGQLVLRSPNGDMPLYQDVAQNGSFAGQLAASDIEAFLNDDVSIKGEFYEVDGRRVLAIQEYMPGIHQDFIAGRVTRKYLRGVAGRYLLPKSIFAAMSAYGKEDFARVGLLLAGNEMWMLISGRENPMAEEPNEVDPASEAKLRAEAKAGKRVVMGFQTPGLIDGDPTDDVRGVLEVPRGVKISKQFQRAFVKVEQIEAPIPQKTGTNSWRRVRAGRGYKIIGEPASPLPKLSTKGKLHPNVKRVP